MSNTMEMPHDRKVLNEGIEKAFMDCAGYAGSIRTHYQTGSGTIRDLFELFYFNLAVLFDLTSDLEGMGASTKECKGLEDWLNLPPVRSNDKEMRDRCEQGLKTFREYKIALTKNGIITLPA
jgi:hypothetical protein